MNCRRVFPVVAAALALAFAPPLTVRTVGNGNAQKPPTDIIVDFGDPVTLAGDANHVVIPEDATIQKGGTVTFVVNGGGHGIAIYPVSKDTTREDVSATVNAASTFARDEGNDWRISTALNYRF